MPSETREEYLERRFKEESIEPLSPEQKEELKHKKEFYLMLKEINEKVIGDYKAKISNIEKKIEEERPSIPGAKYIHKTCGIKAGIYLDHTPSGGDAGGDEVYHCLFCDKDFMSGDIKH